MRGMIRFVVGLVIVFGAAGGIDTATDSQLIACIAIAAAGLALMMSGAAAGATSRAPILYR